MIQPSLTTRLEHYINTMLPETHAHQRNAFRDFVATLLVVRTCCTILSVKLGCVRYGRGDALARN